MKKLLLVAIAFLFMTSFALAADVPVVNPNSDPSPVTTVVYNNDTSSLSVGDVVCWDADNSTDDDKNYVTATCGADAWHVAGVVWPVAIGPNGVGTIAIFGVVNVNLEDALLAGSIICGSSTANKAELCSNTSYAIGILTENSGVDKTAQAMITIVSIGSNFPRAVDPVGGPEVWTVPVYSASALDVGNLVQWCVDDSTGDNDYWVEVTADQGTTIVAGIVWPAPITAGGTGSIAVRGIVTGETAQAGTIDSGDLVCASGTDGTVEVCGATHEIYSIGHGLATESNGSVLLFINP